MPASSPRANWREDQEGAPPRCGLIVGSMGLIFAEKALYGSDAATTNPAKSSRALGSALRGMRTVSCGFIFGTARLSAVQDRSMSVDGVRSGSVSSIPMAAVHPEPDLVGCQVTDFDR